MNEDTIIESAPMSKENTEPQGMQTKNGNSWVNVTLSGITGILMGAGAVLGVQAYGKSKIGQPEVPESTPAAAGGGEETDGMHSRQIRIHFRTMNRKKLKCTM